MSDLKEYSNIYADLSQAAYNGRTVQFPYQSKKYNKNQQEAYKNNDAIPFNFENLKGGENLGNSGVVYLQPDKSGALTDKSAGYNSYFVTDTPHLDSTTNNTYFVTRGSDGMSKDNLNDWVGNNADFTLNDAYIQQAQIATQAMHQKITEIRASGSQDTTMSVTGHSLGTMVSIQAVANLPAEDIDKIDRVVLFNGPDARESLNKMSQQARDNIKKLEAAGKIDYYVHPFDIVSMLNRNEKGVDEIGNVKYIMPVTMNGMLPMNDSAHDFGQYQFNSDGSIKEATLASNPEMFVAGAKLSKLIQKTVDKLGISKQDLLMMILTGNVPNEIKAAGFTVTSFIKQYNDIVTQAKLQYERNENITRLHDRINSSSGSEKIKLQEELARAVAEKAKSLGEEYQLIVENELNELEDEIDTLVQEVSTAAVDMGQHLSNSEIESLISEFTKTSLWDSGQAESIKNDTKKWDQKLTDFSDKLKIVSTNIKTYDGEAGANLFKNKK